MDDRGRLAGMLELAAAYHVSKHVQGRRWPRVKPPAWRARQIPGTPVAARVLELERRVGRQEAAMRELASRMDAGAQHREGKVVACMENAFKTLDHVVGVHYAVLRDGTWHVVAVHDMEDGGRALRSICKKAVEVQNAFCGVEIAPAVLHVDEVRREHLAGTKAVFKRPRG